MGIREKISEGIWKSPEKREPGLDMTRVREAGEWCRQQEIENKGSRGKQITWIIRNGCGEGLFEGWRSYFTSLKQKWLLPSPRNP